MKKLYWQYYIKKPLVTYKYERDKLFETLTHDSTDIIFLGDSIVQHFEIFEYLKNVRIKNRGIGGDTTLGVLQRLELVAKGKPLQCFIHVGINDVLEQVSLETIIHHHDLIIQKLKKEASETAIFIVSILPVSNYMDKRLESIEVNAKVSAINDLLWQMCNTHNVTFINVHKELQGSIGLKTSCTVDGVHLNGKGYKIMAQTLEPYLTD